MLAGVAKLWSRRGIAAMTSLSMLLPEGDETLTPHLAFIDDVLDAPWPEDPLLLCAVRRRDSRRTVFGPGASTRPSRPRSPRPARSRAISPTSSSTGRPT